MSTMSTNAGIEPRSKLLARLSDIPWLTVLPLAVAMALADGYWLISLRGAVGAIERSGHPTSSWLQESALALPIFVLAVIGALALANRWFASAPEKSKTLVLTALLVVVTGTLVGIAALVASSAYDYHLQSGVEHSMGSMGSMGTMDVANQASFALQVRAAGIGSLLILVTNLVVIGWMVGLFGGRLGLSKTRH